MICPWRNAPHRFEVTFAAAEQTALCTGGDTGATGVMGVMEVAPTPRPLTPRPPPGITPATPVGPRAEVAAAAVRAGHVGRPSRIRLASIGRSTRYANRSCGSPRLTPTVVTCSF